MQDSRGIYEKCIRNYENPVKAPCFIKLDFLREVWLIQNLKCILYLVKGWGNGDDCLGQNNENLLQCYKNIKCILQFY